MRNGESDPQSVNTDLQVDDKYLALKDAARQWPGSPRYEQVWRWAQRGLPLVDGTLRLRTIRTNRIVTRMEWMQEFIAAMDAAHREGRILKARPRRTRRPTPRPQVVPHEVAMARQKAKLGLT